MIRIVAYQPDIAQNLGNMIRSAACFGVSIDVIEPCGFPFSTKALQRAAMDYAKLADIQRYDDWTQYNQTVTGRKILLTTKSKQSYLDFEFSSHDALILGRESAGVPDDVAQDCDHAITIPMPGGGRSLNVANSAAIAITEALRQLGAL